MRKSIALTLACMTFIACNSEIEKKNVKESVAVGSPCSVENERICSSNSILICIDNHWNEELNCGKESKNCVGGDINAACVDSGVEDKDEKEDSVNDNDIFSSQTVKAYLNCRNDRTGEESFESISEEVALDASKSGLYDEKGKKITDEEYINQYKWQFVEMPTASIIYNNGEAIENKWIDKGIATFRGYVTTPNNVGEKTTPNQSKCVEITEKIDAEKKECVAISDAIEKEICEDAALHDNLYEYNLYCDEYKDSHYLLKMSVKVCKKSTNICSEEASTFCRPEIVPKSRVQVQLQWKGYGNDSPGTGKGMDVDLDLHIIRKTGEVVSSCLPDYKDGYMCTKAEYANNGDFTNTHDDVYFGDPGNVEGAGYEWSGQVVKTTNNWNSTIDIDNTFGNGIETINVGPYRKNLDVLDGTYLVVVNYFNCTDYSNSGQCEKPVEPTILITIDGKDAPRATVTDPLHPDSDKIIKKFKIMPNQYAVIAEVEWNSQWSNIDITKKGNGQVRHLTNYKWCTIQDCRNAPIWDQDEYVKWVEKSYEYPHSESSSTSCETEGVYANYGDESNPVGRGKCASFNESDITIWSEKE